MVMVTRCFLGCDLGCEKVRGLRVLSRRWWEEKIACPMCEAAMAALMLRMIKARRKTRI